MLRGSKFEVVGNNELILFPSILYILSLSIANLIHVPSGKLEFFENPLSILPIQFLAIFQLITLGRSKSK